jgi:acetolactate synthase-1/2/3 large subunit
MGYAVPAAVGAALASPDRDVIALAGDGALLMTGLEALTASAYGVAPVICVLRDGELAQIAQFQRTALGSAMNSVLPAYSVRGLADAVQAQYLACPNDASAERVLRDALDTARSGRVVFVDVAIDYSTKTFFTKGIVRTTFTRLPWRDRLAMLGRAISRRLQRR